MIQQKKSIKKLKVSISLDEKLLMRIDEVCQENYWSRSLVISEAVKRFLDEDE